MSSIGKRLYRSSQKVQYFKQTAIANKRCRVNYFQSNPSKSYRPPKPRRTHFSHLPVITPKSYTPILGRLHLHRHMLRIRIPGIKIKPRPLREKQRTRMTHRQSSNSNHNHRAIKNHERRLVVGGSRPETACKLNNTVDAPDLDSHGGDGDSCEEC